MEDNLEKGSSQVWSLTYFVSVDKPIFMPVPESLLAEFGSHHRLEKLENNFYLGINRRTNELLLRPGQSPTEQLRVGRSDGKSIKRGVIQKRPCFFRAVSRCGSQVNVFRLRYAN